MRTRTDPVNVVLGGDHRCCDGAGGDFVTDPVHCSHCRTDVVVAEPVRRTTRVHCGGTAERCAFGYSGAADAGAYSP